MKIPTQAEVSFLSQYPNFTFAELACPCRDPECELPIDAPEFLSWCNTLQNLRIALGFPFHVTSFYRCPIYNDDLYIAMGADPEEHMDGPHVQGATDLLISFERMYVLVDEALSRGMGVGLKQHGAVGKRYVHLDNQGSRLWTYPN